MCKDVNPGAGSHISNNYHPVQRDSALNKMNVLSLNSYLKGGPFLSSVPPQVEGW